MDISTVIYLPKNKKYSLPNAKQESSKNSSPLGQGNRFLEGLSQNKFKTGIKEYLSPDASGKVNEEQLQFAIVNTMLTSKSIKLGDEFTKNFAKAAASSSSVEDNVKLALGGLVDSKLITAEEAKSINGISFDAAQLDGNLSALYDGRGSANDPTIAVAELDEALTKASTMIAGMRDGKVSIKDRELSLPSNLISSTEIGASAKADAVALGNTGNSISISTGGFLWKPVSESNGKLVVLLPSSLAGKVSAAEIHSSLPPSDTTLLESGKFSSNANGGRDHFRFSNAGGAYPDSAYVVAKLKTGDYASFQIGDSASRNSK